MRRVPRWLAAAGAAATCLAGAPSALAATTPPPPTQPPWSTFADCPTSTPGLTSCVYSATTSGSFTIGKTTVSVGSTPIIFQGGIITGAKTDTFVPAADGNTLSQVPLTVPGGLLGLTPPDLFPPPLQWVIDQAINTFNGVTATAELVSPPSFSFEHFLTGQGPTVTLPVRIQLNNPFLGNACFIGSAADPVILRLTTGKTKPPAGVTRLKGTHGTLGFFDNGNVVAANGDSIVDNTFAVPGASGCGGLLAPLVDPIVNLKTGIPSAAGTNSAILNGTAALASASEVIANGQ